MTAAALTPASLAASTSHTESPTTTVELFVQPLAFWESSSSSTNSGISLSEPLPICSWITARGIGSLTSSRARPGLDVQVVSVHERPLYAQEHRIYQGRPPTWSRPDPTDPEALPRTPTRSYGRRPRRICARFGAPLLFLRGAQLGERRAARDPKDLAADVARLLGGEKDVGRRQLGRLGRAPDGGLRRAELRDLLGGHGSRDQRRPHRPRRHRVDPDAPRYQVLGEPLREGDDRALGGGVVQERRLGLVGLDGGGVDDARARPHVRDRRLDEPEHSVDVSLQDAVELLGRYVLNATGLRHLVGGVVDEDVYLPELVHGFLHDVPAVGLVPDVARYPNRLPAGLLDDPRRLCGVLLFLFEVGDQDVRPLAGEGERHGPPDAGVAAGDHRLLALEPAGAAVGPVPVVRPGAHLLLVARLLELLLAEVRLRVLGGRVLLGVLVGHESPFVLWFACSAMPANQGG